MDISNMFWNASLDELKQGYVQQEESFTCLLCGEQVEKGVIYPYEDRLYEAQKFMRIHIEIEHDSVFHYLLNMDKKMTGITDHQKSLLQLFYQGKTDKEIQQELGIGSTSTIRQHRFALKEKERQAKIFLAMMELLKDADRHAPTFLTVHKTATMIDDRYNTTEEEQQKILQKYFSNGFLTKFPPKEKQRLVVLKAIISKLQVDSVYDEQQLNEALKQLCADYVLVRRYLVDYGFLDRKPDGSAYWVKK